MNLNIPIEDRFEMMDVFAKYAWYNDLGRAEEWASLFTPDGILEAVLPGETEPFAPGGKVKQFVGRDGLIAYVKANFPDIFGIPRAHQLHHHFDMIYEEFTGNAATTRSYSCMTIQLNAPEVRDPIGPILFMHGYCIDKWEKHEGKWLYKRRTYHPFGYHSSYFDWNDPSSKPAIAHG
jgi:hypothetical protein